MKLYSQNDKPLTPEQFLNPGSEYRGAPFWAWNNKLDKGELLWQIDQLKAMGYPNGGRWERRGRHCLFTIPLTAILRSVMCNRRLTA